MNNFHNTSSSRSSSTDNSSNSSNSSNSNNSNSQYQFHNRIRKNARLIATSDTKRDRDINRDRDGDTRQRRAQCSLLSSSSPSSSSPTIWHHPYPYPYPHPQSTNIINTILRVCVIIAMSMLPLATSLTNLLVYPPIPISPSTINTITTTISITKPTIKTYRYNTHNHRHRHHHRNTLLNRNTQNQNQIYKSTSLSNTNLQMSPNYIELFTNPDPTYDDTTTTAADENSSKWLAWMTGGKQLDTSPRKTAEVKMRDPEELGGLPRAERYASRDWLHNTINMPNSVILKSVRFPVTFMTCWGLVISFIHYRLKKMGEDAIASRFCIPTAPHSLMVSALGLLLVFRTNSAYQRFSEGRKIWEEILSIARDLSRMVKLYEGEIGTAKLRRLNRLLAAFPYLLRFRIRPNSIMKRIDDQEVKRDPEHSLILYQDHGKCFLYIYIESFILDS